MQANLAREHSATVWDQARFALGRSVFAGLTQQLDKYDAAVFVLAPDDVSKIRDDEFAAVRDNVLIELGMFTGRLGCDRTFWVAPRDDKFRIPSDLLGIVQPSYEPPFDDDWQTALAVPATRICDALRDSVTARAAEKPPLSTERLHAAAADMDGMLARLARAMKRRGASQVNESDGRWRVRIGERSTITVSFGRLESVPGGEGFVYLLPANEYFDDDCITDRASVLGAFVASRFPGKCDEFSKLVRQHRQKMRSFVAQRAANEYHDSYGVGSVLYLDRPLGSDTPVILAAVTRARAGEGIKAEPHYIFAALREAHRCMNEHKRTHVVLPLLGSGHGDISPELSLFVVAHALVGMSQDIRSAEVVVYRRDEQSRADVDLDVVKTILSAVDYDFPIT